jgi:hypothetical protein
MCVRLFYLCCPMYVSTCGHCTATYNIYCALSCVLVVALRLAYLPAGPQGQTKGCRAINNKQVSCLFVTLPVSHQQFQLWSTILICETKSCHKV